MSCCTLFNRSLFSDAKLNTETVDLQRITRLIPSYDSSYSGIWRPIVVTKAISNHSYVDLLAPPKIAIVNSFNPCNCSPVISDYSLLEQETDLSCDYCNGMSPTEFGDCCTGSCDTRMHKDDYLPKIPLLNQKYFNKFYDFKYHNQFPAVSNTPLGFEQFVKISELRSFTSSTSNSVNLVIDWSIKERMGEVPYDPQTSQYDNQDDHNKAYAKFLHTGKTCGNFILTKLNPDFSGINPYYPMFSGLIGEPNQSSVSKQIYDILPSVEKFKEIPHGFDKQTYNNIFVKGNKVGSHWKWNYSSGILGWYRYYDVHRANDTRVIPKIDLYISPGDVFYATNDGPEPAPTAYGSDSEATIKPCPSGLKLMNSSVMIGVIPSGSSFTYISSNLYSNFINIYQRLTTADLLETNKLSAIKKFELAALLCTAPQYDQITLDLLKRNSNFPYLLNEFNQLSGLNKDMATSQLGSISKLDYIQTKEDLINTLANKYGAYAWFPSQSSSYLELSAPINSQSYIDLDFDTTVKLSDTLNNRGGSQTTDCNTNTFRKNFDYSQAIELSNLKIETKTDTRTRYNNKCNNGVMETDKSARMAGVYLNNTLIKEKIHTTGYEYFYDEYNNVTLERKYNVTALNPRIDKAAFHHQGGIYYDSKAFGVNNSTVFISNSTNLNPGGKAKVQFNNKDVGIKLYGLKIEKLRGQNSDTYECPAFPTQNHCQCFGLNTFAEYPYVCNGSLTFTNSPLLFTPGLSTTYSPVLKAYGGYSLDYINQILGSDRIPNHPSPGSNLTSVDQKINPEQPYGCEHSITINLPNYVQTSWSFSLPSYNTIHADVWAEVLEDVDLFKPTSYSEVYGDDGWEPIAVTNLGYQRFASKVDLNGTILYDKQKKNIISKGGGIGTINATITNPYLESLLGSPVVLHPPTGSFCVTNIFKNRGDESVSIPIKFSRIPRKQIINFAIKSPQQMGTLRRGFFHPNSGIKYDYNISNSPIEYRDKGLYVSYDKELFASNADYSQGTVLIGSITEDVKRILSQIDNFDNHKKIRLYLQLNQKWYEYRTDNIYGFNKNNNLYIGEPTLFQYTQDDTKNTLPGPIISLSPKEHLPFDFVYNSVPTGSPIIQYNPKDYPFLYTNLTKEQNRIANIDGARTYFCLGEKDNALISTVDSISNLPENEQNSITVNTPEVVLTNGERWRYKGSGAKTAYGSYMLTDYNRLYTMFSDLHLDFNKKNKAGYIYNSRKACDQTVLIINQQNIKQSYTAKIIEKSLYAINTDQSGNPLNLNDKTSNTYLKLYTKLKLDKDLRYDNSFIDFTLLRNNTQNTEGTDLFILYKNQDSLKKESDHLLFNPNYSVKWGDLLDFDGKLTSEISQYMYGSSYIEAAYPSSLYKNNFFKIIINDTNYKTHRYNINLNNNNLFITHTGLVNYTIHQKYNVGLDLSTKNTMDEYENYLPFMDLNIPPLPGDNSNAVRGSLQSTLGSMLDQQNIPTGIIKISGVFKNLDKDRSWSDNFIDPTINPLFWINIKNGSLLESALTIKPNKVMYTNTLRIDSPSFQLSSINSTRTLNAEGCLRIFEPIVPQTNTIFGASVFDFSHYGLSAYTGYPFAKFPIYCDTDTLGGCVSERCGISTAGSIGFSGTYNIQKNRTKIISSSDNYIPYILSYDAGIYNPIGNKSLQYIQRLELDPNNNLYPVSSCDSSIAPRPNFNRISVLNEEYQSLMTSSIATDHTAVVSNTDILANEMFFRMIYGEKQKINLKTIDGINNTISFADLIKYTDPKIEAKDIYRNIPYDLDTAANTDNRKISGTINIKGILKVGKTVNITIGPKVFSVSVIRERGKIIARATIDGVNIDAVIFIESNLTNSLMVTSNPVTSPDPSIIKYSLLKKCKELQQQSISLVRAYTSSALYNQLLCDGTRGTVNFPYFPVPDKEQLRQWSIVYRQVQDLRAELRHSEADTLERNMIQEINKGCRCNGSRWSACRSDCDNVPDIAMVHHPGCGYTDALPYDTCTNRGTVNDVSDIIEENCTIIHKTQNTINFGPYARGVFGGCYAEGSINLNFMDQSGDIENAAGGLIIHHPRGFGRPTQIKQPECGTCFTLNYKNPLTNNDRFSSFGEGSFPPSPGNTGSSCECADWEYGYCRNSNNAAACVCSSLQYDYTEFDYTFSYCRYNMTLKGHKRRIKYTPNDQTITRQDACTPFNLSEEERINIADGPSTGRTIEQCAWIECPGTPPTDWHIYDVEVTTNIATYSPVCAQDLCSISYDNNSITISLSGNTKCVTNEIKNSCPNISVDVPDNSFMVVDSIDSRCDTCGVERNKISMSEQNPSWDIITETRTCILGYLLTDGNPNEDGPINTGGQTLPCNICHLCCTNQCCRDEYYNGGRGLCGKNAPESFPWSICISYQGGSVQQGGAVCNGGNRRSAQPSVVGCDIPVTFPYSNDIAGKRIIELWKKQMSQTLLNTAPCQNHRNVFLTADIVEGVVPGSCSDVLYTKISYPAIAYRATLTDPTVIDTQVSYTVAYYTYKYRRPRTIQDVLKGEDIVSRCNEVSSICPSVPLNTVDKYKTIDCDSVPTCYDNGVSSCDDTNYCCRTGRTNYE